jgi:hypothetical protein
MVKKRMSGSSYSILHELIFAISGVIAWLRKDQLASV